MEGNVGIGSMLSEVSDSLMGAFGEALPVAGTIFAAVAGIFFGIKIFKRITGARS